MESEPLPGILNYSSVVYTFFGTLCVGTLSLVRPRRLRSARAWKAIEVATVLLGLLGLYPQMAELRRIVAGNIATQRAGAVEFFYANVKNDVVVYQPAACFKASRSELSPSTFDQIEAAKQKVCELLREAQASLPAEPPATLNIWPKLKAADIGDSYAGDMLRNVLAVGDEYLRVRAKHDALQQAATKRTPTEFNLLLLSPYALAIAAALIIVKILFGPS
jgi:hypothetical protein